MAGPSYSPGPGFGAFVNQLANPPNPMDQLGKTVNALTAMKNYQAQQASEDAVRQSVDPVTGAVDMNKYNSLLSQSAGAFNFSPLARQAGEAVGAQGQATTADENAKMAQFNAIGNLTEPLYKQAIGTNYVNPADAQAALDQAYQMKLVTPQQYQAYSATLKSTQNAASWVIGANTGNEAARTLVLGRPGVADVGGTIQPYQPVPGALPSAAPPMQKTLTPEGALKLQSYLAEPYDYTDKQGVEHKGGTKADFFRDNGINPFAAYTDGTIPAPGSPPSIPQAPAGPVSSVTTGRAPAGAGAPPGTAPPPPGAPSAPTGGGGGRGAPGPTTVPPVPPPPGATGPTEALPQTIIAQGQKDYIAAQAASRTLPDRISPLRNAMGLLRANPDLQTGPGQQQYTQTITGIAAALNLPVPQGVSQQQELAKYLAQYVRGQGQTAGQTDLGRLENEASNPNPTTQSRAALQTLIGKAIGVERLRTAAYDQFNAQYPDAGTAAIHSGRFTVDTTQWLKNQDPTAYAVDEMDPQAVAEYFRGLSGTVTTDAQGRITGTGAKGQFIASRNNAKAMYGIDINPNASVAPPPAAPPPKPPPPRSAPPPPPQPGAAMTPSQIYGSGSSAPPGQ